MAFWSSKTKINSEEYENVLRKIAEISSELEKIKVKSAIMETNYDYLHSKMRKKMQETDKSTESGVLLPTPQVLNTTNTFKI